MKPPQLYTRQPSGTWYVRFDRGIQKSLKTKDEGEAREIYAAILEEWAKKGRGMLASISPRSDQTLGRFRKEYSATFKKRTAKSTFESNCRAIKRLALYAGQRCRIDRISPRHVYQWVADALEGRGHFDKALSPGAVNHDLRHARAALAVAVEWGWVDVNPLAKVKMLVEEKKEPVYLEDEEVFRRILAANRGPEFADHRRMLMAYVATGRRCMELVDLRWRDVRLEERRYLVRKGKRTRGRWFEMNEEFAAVLLSIGPGRMDQFVFTRWRSRGGVYKALKVCFVRAGRPEISIHHLRHTFASWKIAAGVPIKFVQDWLDHSTIRMTERYAHVAPRSKSKELQMRLGPVDLG